MVHSTDRAVQFEDFEDGVPKPTEGQRHRIVLLCRLQVRQERELSRLEDDIKAAKEMLRLTSEVHLPEAMMAAGVIMEQLSDGAKVELKRDYLCAEIRDADSFVGGKMRPGNPGALMWLEQHGAGSLINYDVAMQFGRSQAKLVATILKRVRRWKSASAFKLTEKRAVNAQRLRGWVNERVEAGADLPFELLGVHVRHYAKVTIDEKPNEL